MGLASQMVKLFTDVTSGSIELDQQNVLVVLMDGLGRSLYVKVRDTTSDLYDRLIPSMATPNLAFR